MSGATSSGPMTIEAWIKQRLKREAWAQLLYALMCFSFGIPALLLTVMGLLALTHPGGRRSKPLWHIDSYWLFAAIAVGYFIVYLVISWQPQVAKFKHGRRKENWLQAVFSHHPSNDFRSDLRETGFYLLLSLTFFGPMLIGNSFLSLVTMYRFWEPDCREEARIMLLLRESERAVRISELERLVRGNDLHRSLRNLSYIRGVVEIEVEGEAAFTLSGPTRAELNQLS